MSVGEESAKPEEMVVVLMLVVAVAVVGVVVAWVVVVGGVNPHKILYLRIVQPTVDILEPLWPWRMVWWRW